MANGIQMARFMSQQRQRRRRQCDQMLKRKLAQIFPKVFQKVPAAIFT